MLFLSDHTKANVSDFFLVLLLMSVPELFHPFCFSSEGSSSTGGAATSSASIHSTVSLIGGFENS